MSSCQAATAKDHVVAENEMAAVADPVATKVVVVEETVAAVVAARRQAVAEAVAKTEY